MSKYPVSLFKNVGGSMVERKVTSAKEEEQYSKDGWDDMRGEIVNPPAKPAPVAPAPVPPVPPKPAPVTPAVDPLKETVKK